MRGREREARARGSSDPKTHTLVLFAFAQKDVVGFDARTASGNRLVLGRPARHKRASRDMRRARVALATLALACGALGDPTADYAADLDDDARLGGTRVAATLETELAAFLFRDEGEDAREVPREPGGGRGDEVQVDPRLAQNLRTRRRSRVRDDVHVEPSLLRERERVVLHARGPAEVTEDDHLDAPARARAGRHRARK